MHQTTYGMKTLPKSIVFISGTFLGNNCWNDWKAYYESKGYQCLAPAWPHKDADPEVLRNRHPDAAIASNRLAGLLDYFEAMIDELPDQPVLIGHSFGGLIVQKLLQRGIGEAGVAIHSFPPLEAGTFKLYFLKAWWGAMGLFTSTRKSYMIPFKKWRYAIANGMTCEQQKSLYYKYAIPESKLVIRDGYRNISRVDFKIPHAPLLLISGSQDKIIRSSLNYNNYLKYEMKNSITDYREFNGRNHLVFDHPAWKENADFVLYWLEGIK